MTSHRLQAFLISLLVMLSAIGSVAAPSMAQDEGEPPTIQPSNGAQGAENGGTLEANFELGNGGQPADFPREVTIDGARFLFDRMVPASRQDLIAVAQDGRFRRLRRRRQRRSMPSTCRCLPATRTSWAATWRSKSVQSDIFCPG